ncbi:hypothetical protein [Chelatococcus reniformis]|uniref:DUF805 domain-containing protein n=1 Tax=Chelatococcus reniformis TaxID=1494448 RepID=A0A916XD19_9HYPH|nr:hypothetical protein [Chelatococcus reniformis]GGC62766.1 hypothetical protein GCM10010994_21730 [Chelatococcus reniformis]
MGNISIWHWAIVLALFFLVMFPAAKIARRAGYSGWWCVAAVIPFVSLVVLWVFAYARWPNLARTDASR